MFALPPSVAQKTPRAWDRVLVAAASAELRGRKIWKRTAGLSLGGATATANATATETEAELTSAAELARNGRGSRKRVCTARYMALTRLDGGDGIHFSAESGRANTGVDDLAHAKGQSRRASFFFFLFLLFSFCC